MEQKILLKYFNKSLNIGLFDLKTVYQLQPEIMQLIPEVYKGNLVYRLKGSGKRISYQAIKKGLTRKIFFYLYYAPILISDHHLQKI